MALNSNDDALKAPQSLYDIKKICCIKLTVMQRPALLYKSKDSVWSSHHGAVLIINVESNYSERCNIFDDLPFLKCSLDAIPLCPDRLCPHYRCAKNNKSKKVHRVYCMFRLYTVSPENALKLSQFSTGVSFHQI